jgi:hypothetical protein
MIWQVFSRPEAQNDVIEIADWYNSRSEGLGDRFVEEFLDVRITSRRTRCCLAVDILARIFAGVIPKAFPTE